MRRPSVPPSPVSVPLSAAEKAKAAAEAAKEGKTPEQWVADLVAAELRRRGVAVVVER